MGGRGEEEGREGKDGGQEELRGRGRMRKIKLLWLGSLLGFCEWNLM